MKLITLLLVGLLFASDVPKPKPIPVEKQEQLSRALLDAKDAQIELMQSEAWTKLQSANGRINELLAQLSKDYGAPGCKLTKDKTWDCPKEEPKK